MTYVEPARSLIAGLPFTSGPDSAVPEIARTPGYPAFLAGLMLLTGQSSIAWSMIQGFLSAFLCLGSYFIATRLYGRRAGWVAAVVILVDPITIFSSTVILTETLQSALLLLLGVGLVIATQSTKKRVWPWLIVGLSAALATLVRPSTYYLVILLVLFSASFAIRKKHNWRQTVAGVLAVLIPSLLLVGGWQARNNLLVDSWRVSSIEAVNMYFYRGGDVVARSTGVTLEKAQEQLREEFGSPKDSERLGPYFDRMYNAGVQLVLKDPANATKSAAVGLGTAMLGEGGSFLDRLGLGDDKLAAWLGRAWMAVIWVAAFVAVSWTIARRRDWWTLAGLLLVISYVLLISAGPEAYSRFRVPIMPLVAALAGGGLVIAWKALSARRQPDKRVIEKANPSQWRQGPQSSK
jgi:4-amino-4-deoxy-L-arabinose transferase-like glycosyltransferase